MKMEIETDQGREKGEKGEGDGESDAQLMQTKVMHGYKRGEEVSRDRLKETGKTKDRQMQEIREKNALLPGGDLPGFIPLRYSNIYFIIFYFYSLTSFILFYFILFYFIFYFFIILLIF